MTLTTTAAARPRSSPTPARARVSGVGWLVGAEGISGLLGFASTLILARALGSSGFATLEFATALAGWLLIAVRGGAEVIVVREIARHPRLASRLTDQLLGLKLAGAITGFGLTLAIAGTLGPARGSVLIAAGLVMLPSALSPDVSARAAGRLRLVGAIQCGRAAVALGLVVLVAAMPILDSPRLVGVASVAALAEAVAALLFTLDHARRWGIPRPRFSRRAWAALSGRSVVASLARAVRVGLYAADALVLGLLASADWGPYAAARRLALAAMAITLVIPAGLAPALSRGWADGVGQARRAVERAVAILLGLTLPLSLGMICYAEGAIPDLFGSAYAGPGLCLVLVAARLVPVAFGVLAQSSLTAFRRERSALKVVLGMGVSAIVTLPIAARLDGPRGVGLSVFAIEAAGAVTGWALIARLGVTPRWHSLAAGPAVGGLALAAVSAITRPMPWVASCGLAGLAYLAGLVAFLARDASKSSRFGGVPG